MLTGRQIRAQREGSGLSRTTLADEVGITKKYLAAIEQGRHRPSARVQARIEEALAGSEDISSNGAVTAVEPSDTHAEMDTDAPTTTTANCLSGEIPIGLIAFAHSANIPFRHFLGLLALMQFFEERKPRNDKLPKDESAWAKLHEAVTPFL
jgi:transcriptional regulator with XRE-family HTH domain